MKYHMDPIPNATTAMNTSPIPANAASMSFPPSTSTLCDQAFGGSEG
jgi:hypothetical protein